MMARYAMRRHMVRSYIKDHPNSTAEDVYLAWGCSPNCVAPRITELHQGGVICRTGRKSTKSGGRA